SRDTACPPLAMKSPPQFLSLFRLRSRFSHDSSDQPVTLASCSKRNDMRHHTSQQNAAVESVTRRSFLRLGALAIAQAGLGFVASARASQAEAPAPRFLMEWGKQGTEPGSFQFPVGIAITPGDEIFVTDSVNKRMQQFSTEGKFISQFP